LLIAKFDILLYFTHPFQYEKLEDCTVFYCSKFVVDYFIFTDIFPKKSGINIRNFPCNFISIFLSKFYISPLVTLQELDLGYEEGNDFAVTFDARERLAANTYPHLAAFK
jgi:hypothetical protein